MKTLLLGATVKSNMSGDVMKIVAVKGSSDGFRLLCLDEAGGHLYCKRPDDVKVISLTPEQKSAK